MKPIEFEEQNIVFTKPNEMTDEECSSLPAYKDDHDIISCWEMSLLERIKVLFTGKVWFGVRSYTQPPIWLDVKYPFTKSK